MDMIICKVIGHNYIPNLEKIETTAHGICNEVRKVETKIYNGSVCPRCGDTINTTKIEI